MILYKYFFQMPINIKKVSAAVLLFPTEECLKKNIIGGFVFSVSQEVSMTPHSYILTYFYIFL